MPPYPSHSYRDTQTRQPQSPRTDSNRLDRRSAGRPLPSRLNRNRNKEYDIEAPRLKRGREEYDPYHRSTPSYDQYRTREDRSSRLPDERLSYQHHADEDRRYGAWAHLDRNPHSSTSHTRQREEYNPYHRSTPSYDPFHRTPSSYDEYIQEEDKKPERESYQSNINIAASILPHGRTNSHQAPIQNVVLRNPWQRAQPVRRRGPLTAVEKHRDTIAGFDEWEDSFEPDSDQMDIAGTEEEAALPKFTGRPAIERPFAETRYLPLCRAIKSCLNRSYYALASEVEERLLRDDAHVFHKIDLDSFRQYVFEAKKNGAPIMYTLNVDDQITRVYFCLTRKMMEAAVKEEKETGSVVGPQLEARYMPLYRAMRYNINDEGYSPAHKVDDFLLKEDILLWHKLGVDSLQQYVQQARLSKAPIEFPSDSDFVEKIWFCPTDGMLVAIESSPSRRTSRRTSVEFNTTGETSGVGEEILPQTEFFVMEDDGDEEDRHSIKFRTPSPMALPCRPDVTPPRELPSLDSRVSNTEITVKEEQREAPSLISQMPTQATSPLHSRRQQTPESEEQLRLIEGETSASFFTTSRLQETLQREEPLATQDHESTRATSPIISNSQEMPEIGGDTIETEQEVSRANVAAEPTIDGPKELSDSVVQSQIRQEGSVQVKVEVKTEEAGIDDAAYPSREELMLMPILEDRCEAYQLAFFLMEHRKNSSDPLVAAMVADLMQRSVEEIEALVMVCNSLDERGELIRLEWLSVPGPRIALITMRFFPIDVFSLRFVFTR